MRTNIVVTNIVVTNIVVTNFVVFGTHLPISPISTSNQKSWSLSLSLSLSLSFTQQGVALTDLESLIDRLSLSHSWSLSH